MQIENKRVISLTYTLKDNDDNVIDQSNDGSFCYLHGASNIIPGLENALAGKAAGDELSVSIPPEEGYGVTMSASRTCHVTCSPPSRRSRPACSSMPRVRKDNPSWL
jgi:FKBP-type peptidyl-prolyl cis-trans isomerase 2